MSYPQLRRTSLQSSSLIATFLRRGPRLLTKRMMEGTRMTDDVASIQMDGLSFDDGPSKHGTRADEMMLDVSKAARESNLSNDAQKGSARSDSKRDRQRGMKGQDSAKQGDAAQQKLARAAKANGGKPYKEQARSEKQKTDSGPLTARHDQAGEEIKGKRKEDDRERAKEWRLKKEMEEAIERVRTLMYMEGVLRREKEQALAWSKDGEQSQNRLELIGRQVRRLWMSTRPSFAQAQGREQLIRDVQSALERHWPKCGLRVEGFGSTMTGLVESTSDVDLCLIDPTRPHGVGTPVDQVLPLPNGAECRPVRDAKVIGIAGVPDYYSVRMLASALRHFSVRHKFHKVVPIIHANVPIVKFVHTPTGLSCDLNVNDMFGVRNSAMIRAYLDVNPTIAEPFVFCVKKWASKRGINDPSGQSGLTTLNSYTVVLIALQFLQVRGIVPNLQEPALLSALQTPSQHLWQRPKGKNALAAAANVPSTVAGKDATSTSNENVAPGDDADEGHSQVEESALMPCKSEDSVTGARLFDTTFASLRCRNKTKEHLDIAEQISASRSVSMPFTHRLNISDKGAEFDTLLGDLLTGFFDWLSSFQFDQCGFSLRLGSPIRRHLSESSSDPTIARFPFEPTRDERWPRQPLLCQDPFIVDRNTCGAVLAKGFTSILEEIKRAKGLLSEQEGFPSLGEVLATSDYEKLQMLHGKRIQQLDAKRREEVALMAEKQGVMELRGKAIQPTRDRASRSKALRGRSSKSGNWRERNRGKQEGKSEREQHSEQKKTFVQ